MNTTIISPAELRGSIERGRPLHLVDVRTPGEFAQVHAVGARSMPLDALDPAAVSALRRDPAEPIYLICQSGQRATKACQQLHNGGVDHVYCLEGGTVAWQKLGLPVERGESAVISLERQVRIGAGSMVLLGTVLAWHVHPAFLLIPAMVGAGLLFAGVTDYCGMAMVFCKMPWNR